MLIRNFEKKQDAVSWAWLEFLFFTPKRYQYHFLTPKKERRTPPLPPPALFINVFFKFIVVSQVQFSGSIDSDKQSEWRLWGTLSTPFPTHRSASYTLCRWKVFKRHELAYSDSRVLLGFTRNLCAKAVYNYDVKLFCWLARIFPFFPWAFFFFILFLNLSQFWLSAAMFAFDIGKCTEVPSGLWQR